jgi:hypothetical protein
VNNPIPVVQQVYLNASYGSSASNTGTGIDTGPAYGDIVFAVAIGVPTGLSTTNYYWFEIVESSSANMSGPVSIAYSSGRVSGSPTRSDSAGDSELHRMTSSSGNTFVTHTFRVRPDPNYRYVTLKMHRAAGVATIPMSGVAIYVPRRHYS